LNYCNIKLIYLNFLKHLFRYIIKQFKIIVEKHSDGYIAYPMGLKGVIIGEGDTYEEALADVKSAIKCHIETFGLEDL
jgi:predicted RNase H-like HicB family nuclease